MLIPPSFAGNVLKLKNPGWVDVTAVAHGFAGTPLYVACQEILSLPAVLSSTTLVIVHVKSLPWVTERSSPFQMIPTRSVSRPLWNAVTRFAATAPAVSLWQLWQFVAAVMLSWNV